jgi:hypothetical protein
MSDQILNYLTGTDDSSVTVAPPLNENDADQAAEFLGNLSGLKVYPRSITAIDQSVVFLGKREGNKHVGVLSLPNKAALHITGEVSDLNLGGQTCKLIVGETSHENAQVMRALFPFLNPQPLGLK